MESTEFPSTITPQRTQNVMFRLRKNTDEIYDKINFVSMTLYRSQYLKEIYSYDTLYRYLDLQFCSNDNECSKSFKCETSSLFPSRRQCSPCFQWCTECESNINSTVDNENKNTVCKSNSRCSHLSKYFQVDPSE